MKLVVELTPAQESRLAAFLVEQEKIVLQRQKASMSPEDFDDLTCQGKYAYTGTIGADVSYIITPTSIGTVVKARYCLTNAEINLTDYDQW
jgi:hypothetical protein